MLDPKRATCQCQMLWNYTQEVVFPRWSHPILSRKTSPFWEGHIFSPKKNKSLCYPNSAFTEGFMAASLRDQRGLTQGRSGSASALKCCKTHTLVTPTPKKPKWNCIFFVFAVKHNEFGAFSVQDALEAPMAATAPRDFPRELPESLRKLPRCLREQKNTVWVLALGLFFYAFLQKIFVFHTNTTFLLHYLSLLLSSTLIQLKPQPLHD